ncbi:uncharacterized protein MJAP1_003526 [Malassezia japonica]|uniref:Uncharacterized protein n=1 Tax=Malassezia japonica TaxID=223818 RepID=A0AAF0F0K5_9BASI|nr:uncharacterized protein MJAP1_003526 [Malassezia japonica]WFD40540.1 hypothetical protein MJAP1_003526 [Malassezia japonica]
MSDAADVDLDSEQRSNLIKLAADGYLESHSVHAKPGEKASAVPDRVAQAVTPDDASRIALTADNLGQIPEAEQLAPGIRLPEHVMNESQRLSTQAEAPPPLSDHHPHSAHPGMPPELDPRTPVFRPCRPSAGSVFSVAVQPGSPRSVAADLADKHEAHKPDSPPYTYSTHTGSPPSDLAYSSRATTPVHSAGRSGSAAAQHSTGRTASIADSEAGSVVSDLSSSAYSGDVREQELAIERQRMRERELMGGETGIGGPVPIPFARLQDNLGQLRNSQSYRSMSTAATVATSPSTSVRGSDCDHSVSPSRRSTTSAGDSLLWEEPSVGLSTPSRE